MTSASRYQRREIRAERHGIVSWIGVDAVTGLPVLVYDVPGRPCRQAESLESEHIPAVLASSFDGRRGELVVAFSQGYRALRPEQVDDEIVTAAARALRDASAAGIAHGDLRPARFLAADGHVLVEGYGVPWQPSDTRFAAPETGAGHPQAPSLSASLQADVYAFATTFIELGRGRLGAGTVAALTSAATPDPAERPDPAVLCTRLEEAARSGGAESSADPDRVQASVLRPRVTLSGTPQGHEPDPEPLVIDSGSGEKLIRTSGPQPASPKPGSGSFSKQPPPGTRYRSGHQAPASRSDRPEASSVDDGRHGNHPRRTYRFAVLGATLVLTAVLAFLALSGRQERFRDPIANRTVVYVVDVSVQPESLPPVRLFVVEGPDTSKWQPGTELGNVPGRIVLDREGTWRFQGRFQDRLSQVVTLELPSQRQFTLSFPSTQSDRAP